MKTSDNTDSKSSGQPQPFNNSAFAALTVSGGTIALEVAEQTPAKTASPVSPTLPKLRITRRVIKPLPKRGATSTLSSETPAGETAVTETPLKEAAPVPSPAPETTLKEAAPAPSPAPETTLKEAAPAPSPAPAPDTTAVVAIVAPAPAPAPSAKPAPAVLTGWDLLAQHKKQGSIVRGHVTRVIYSREDARCIVGVKARVAGLEGFVPFRMLGMSPLDAEHAVTLEMGFRIVELEKGVDGAKDRIILNRQLVITDEKTTALIQAVKLGDTVTGVIRKIMPFGAFIDIDGASALIHVNDLPQGNISTVKLGQKVTASVVKVNKAENKLGASIKHYFVSHLAVGAEFTGRVKNEEQFGVFVLLNETVDGLVHVSQFADFTPTRGDTVTVKVLSINKERGQVQLALLDVKAAQAD